MYSDSSLRVLARVNDLGVGGTQLNALDFALGLRPFGVETTLVGFDDTLPDAGPTLVDIAEVRGVHVEVLQRGKRRERVRRVRELTALADHLRVDLVHAYGFKSANEAFWGPCRFGRRPLVHTVYEMAIAPSVYRHTTLVVGTRELLDQLKPSRDQVFLVSPPVDLTSDSPNSVDVSMAPFELQPVEGRLRVVIVSRLAHEMKAFGVRVAIRAMRNLPRRDVDLIVVGAGPAEGELRELAGQVNQSLGRQAVSFTGMMADPRPAYALADVVVGMGGSAARALAFGRPLVVVGEAGYAAGFTPECSEQLFYRSFWSPDAVAEPEDVFIRALMPMLESADTRAQLGAFGRDFAAGHFGLPAMSARLYDAYRHAVQSYGPVDWLREWQAESIRAGQWLRWKLSEGSLRRVLHGVRETA